MGTIMNKVKPHLLARQQDLLACDISAVVLQPRLRCPAAGLENIEPFDAAPNLFDYGAGSVIRKINASYLDKKVSTVADFEDICTSASAADTVYIVDDRAESTNGIVNSFNEITMRAYICRFEEKGMTCYVCHE